MTILITEAPPIMALERKTWRWDVMAGNRA
jgi:hypothetical protein